MITIDWLYIFAGAVFAGFAVGSYRGDHPKRLGNSAFWLLLAISFWFGDRLGDTGNGILVLLLVLLAGAKLLGKPSLRTTSEDQRKSFSDRFGNGLFVPALVIPITAFVGTFLFTYSPLRTCNCIETKSVTLILLGAGVIIALVSCYLWFRAPALSAIDEGARLADSIGWALVLPQMLASLGAVFAAAGIGTTIGSVAGSIIPNGSIFLGVLLYALGMVVFTIIMGNAFAAFPVMAAAIGVPILIHADHGNAAVIGAVGMLAGYCGTLLTPMAANFNIVPSALLELKNQYSVIKAQIPAAILLLIANILILYVFGFHL